jgi:hypothetical protein
MENQPNVENPLKKAVLLMLVSISITIVGFLLLAFVAVNLPEDSLFRRSGTSKLKNWLPENIDLPPDMILVSEYKSTNRDVADNYPNPTEVLDRGKGRGEDRGFFSALSC